MGEREAEHDGNNSRENGAPGPQEGFGGRMSPPADVDSLFSIKIDPLPSHIDDDMLRQTFGKYGQVRDVYIPKVHGTSLAKGFAFVRYGSRDEVERILSEAAGDGGKLRTEGLGDISVEWAVARKTRDDRDRRGYDRDSRGTNGYYRNGPYERYDRYGGGRDDRDYRYNDRGNDRDSREYGYSRGGGEYDRGGNGHDRRGGGGHDDYGGRGRY
ncbi:unnamed protein product [Vitrella brassicaformis CCMP3155]|uniref:RRM domain-containing protein n=1 Tax=Vitrella brassicaformis (strain CCMP3155) TaxID=1169540 RepID=A0A0G4F438_VITBC|nr:unnamed protein product [Vitrella brassicaformis CCMP3155]|mmetsp:Transcript_17837/g.42902  ORF Transcript_17837/g.42902 Transcript_17837/m.42902 type:complete len:213 (-) Transcript_17837:120-758(-)|eukprot:CEM07002.1 unnamed protein product [Vitrella brassicaformis CCMP3155]